MVSAISLAIAAYVADSYRANAFMNAWDSEAVRWRYEKQTMGSLTSFGSKTKLHPSRVAMAFRNLVLVDREDPDDPQTLEKAKDETRHVVSQRIPFETLNWGTFTMMLSELGKTKELNDLLEYADEKLQPTWENGGLFYPRNDRLADKEWNLLHMEPHSGNSGIGYARLNVENGQKMIWEKPWTRETLLSRPWVEGVSFADGVDFLRGIWDEEKRVLVVTLRLWRGDAKHLTIIIRHLPQGHWAAYVDGFCVVSEKLSDRGDLLVNTLVGEQEVDVVIEVVSEA
jgi:hypothetical protein